MAGYWLAQLNLGRLRAPLDSPEVVDFVANLEPVNAVADASPGFVWRLQTEEGNATALRALGDDTLLVNMSVWDSLEALVAFVYRSNHLDVLRRRREWFQVMSEAYLVLWWVEAGHIPFLAEGEERLVHLRRFGSSPHAFTFKEPQPAPSGATASSSTAGMPL